MSIRILHTADLHIGMSFHKYPVDVRERLVQERFEALHRMVGTANDREVHFLVVAGDLFDKTSVTATQVSHVVEVLKQFTGEAVLVLPGNHDFCEGTESTLWTRFAKVADHSNVHVMNQPVPWHFEVEDTSITFLPCPCPSKYGSEPVIAWVREAPRVAGSIHVGVAHGNVDGLGLDKEQQYFNMTEGELRDSGVNLWLLGHIHVPSPAQGTTGTRTFYMPGIPTPDSVRCTHAGHAWFLELESDGSCRHEQLTTGALRFVRLERTLRHATDIDALRLECAELLGPSTVLDLQLSGRLGEDDLALLRELRERIAADFLHQTVEASIHPLLDRRAIAARFTQGTLPFRLLTALVEDNSYPDDAHFALDMVESLRSQ